MKYQNRSNVELAISGVLHRYNWGLDIKARKDTISAAEVAHRQRMASSSGKAVNISGLQ